MKMLDTSNLEKRDTKAGYSIAGFGVKPIWSVDNVVIAYKNAFDEEIADVFKITFKQTDEGAVITASATTQLQFLAPLSWESAQNVPFADYDGRYDDLPKAGLGGTLMEVLSHGNGVHVLTAPLQKIAAASIDKTFADNEEN